MSLAVFKNTIGAFVFVLGIYACQNDKPVPPIHLPIEADTSLVKPQNNDKRSETLFYKNKTSSEQLQNVFGQIPATHWQTLSFRGMDKTIKQELLTKGFSMPFMVEINNHCLRIKEVVQNEDDDKEERNMAEIAVFAYDNANKWLVFICEQAIKKDESSTPKLIRQSFWEYDGKIWSDAGVEMPIISEAMFFDNPPNTIFNKKEPLMLRADSKKPDLLSVIVPERLLAESVQHSINLLWNGEKFEVQIK
jgi:hypothetical protein